MTLRPSLIQFGAALLGITVAIDVWWMRSYFRISTPVIWEPLHNFYIASRLYAAAFAVIVAFYCYRRGRVLRHR